MNSHKSFYPSCNIKNDRRARIQLNVEIWNKKLKKLLVNMYQYVLIS